MKTIFSLLFGFFIMTLSAQNIITTASGVASGSGGNMSYSIGLGVDVNCTGMNGSLSGGIQHPFEIYETMGIKSNERINLSCSVYPNPIVDYLILDIEKYDKCIYSIFDINGKQIKTERVINNKTIIRMDDYIPSIYLLRISKRSIDLKTYKIIKH